MYNLWITLERGRNTQSAKQIFFAASNFIDSLARIGTIVETLESILNEEEQNHKNVSVNMDCTKGIEFKNVAFSAKLIAGFWDIKEGTVTLNGHDLKDIPLEQLNDQIAYVSQENYLFDDTIRENIKDGK